MSEETARIVETVLEELRPRLKADGGDVELVTVEEDRVIVRMTGQCAGCGLAAMTLGGLRARLVQALGRPVRVIPEDMARFFRAGAA